MARGRSKLSLNEDQAEKVKTKKLNFFKFCIYDKGVSQSCNTMTTIFKSILDTHGSVDVRTGRKSYILSPGDEQVSLEVMDNTDDYLIARFGIIRDNNAAQWRHLDDQSTEPLADENESSNKGLELFTYVLLDYANFIVTIMSSQGTPSKNLFCNIINEFSDYNSSLVAIAHPDVIKEILTTTYVKSIEFEFAVPDPNMIDDVQLSLEQKEVLRKNDSLTVAFQIKNKNGSPIISSPSDVEIFFNSFMPYLADPRTFFKKLNLNRKKLNEKKYHSLNIVKPKFSDEVDIPQKFKYDKERMYDVYKSIILEKYRENKTTLELYCDRHRTK